jgi:hypothetical protein
VTGAEADRLAGARDMDAMLVADLEEIAGT